MDNKRPFIRLHEHSCSLGTGGVVGSGTAAMRALHTAARRLLHSLLTIVALLMEEIKGEEIKHRQSVQCHQLLLKKVTLARERSKTSCFSH